MQSRDTRPYWYIFKDRTILAKSHTEELELPRWGSPEEAAVELTYIRKGEDNNIPFYAGVADEKTDAPPEYEFIEVRPLFGALEGTSKLQNIVKHMQITEWEDRLRFCPTCREPLQKSSEEYEKFCTICGFRFYPPISPAIIVAITKGNLLLLAHNRRFPSGRYSLIAGFTEPGETLEECVGREVEEEVGIKVRNIRYYGSQPWPFPHSLMIGFTAEHKSGEITVDGREILDARWFTADSLPNIPPHGSISRVLIDWFIANSSHKGDR